METLTICQFGNPILRKKAKRITKREVQSEAIQSLIKQMRHTLLSKKLGIGLAAPQVGKDLSLAVIAIRPTDHRPTVKEFDLVIINPNITRYFGKPKPVWEGCISSGVGEANLFGKADRYAKIELTYTNENGARNTQLLSGLAAQVVQHETDHLNGILFVDRVSDSKTYMTMQEYKLRIRKIPQL